MAKSNEPIWWSLFSAGGVVTALFLPVLILLTGIAIPLGWIDESAFTFERMSALASHWLSRVAIFMVIMLSFFHAAHRLRYVLVDLGLARIARPITIACYGGAILGTLCALSAVVRL